MPKLLDRSIEEVRRRADVLAVVGDVVALKKRGVSWVGLCPFHSEKTPSFRVTEGKGYKCFGCDAKGDALRFVMEREGLEFIPAVEKLAARFGVLLEYDEPLRARGGPQAVSAGGAAPAVPEGIDPARVLVLPEGADVKAAKRAISRQVRYEAQRNKEAAVEARWIKAHQPSVERRPLWDWSGVVSGRFADGAVDTEKLAAALAQERGWQEQWVWWLLDEGLISWPELPWSRSRSVAFRVDGPALGRVPDEARTNGDRTVVRDVRAVGYHQRFVVDGRKSWVYVPYWAGSERLSAFQAAMREAESKRGRTDADGLVPALPFFMGVRDGLRFLVITEGQWDAVTFAGAMGWLDSDTAWPEGVTVMGSRGSTGVDTLLAYWGEWLGEWRPPVLVLADNDVAGKKWDEPPKTELGALRPPTFTDKLRAGGAGKVVVSRVRSAVGKDFNDFWKARRPSRGALVAWLHGLGLGLPRGWIE